MSEWSEEWERRKRGELQVPEPEAQEVTEYGARVVLAYRVDQRRDGSAVVLSRQIKLGGTCAGTWCYREWAGCDLSAVGEGWRATPREALEEAARLARGRLEQEQAYLVSLEDELATARRSSGEPARAGAPRPSRAGRARRSAGPHG